VESKKTRVEDEEEEMMMRAPCIEINEALLSSNVTSEFRIN
jgi:hypothetical protein